MISQRFSFFYVYELISEFRQFPALASSGFDSILFNNIPVIICLCFQSQNGSTSPSSHDELRRCYLGIRLRDGVKGEVFSIGRCWYDIYLSTHVGSRAVDRELMYPGSSILCQAFPAFQLRQGSLGYRMVLVQFIFKYNSRK